MAGVVECVGLSCCLTGAAGGQGGNRTPDTVIFSHVLYQLSYLAAGGEAKV